MDVQLYGSYTRRRYRAATSGEIERMLSAPRLDHRTCPPGRGGDVFIAPAGDDEEFWSAWHARHPQPPVPPPPASPPKPRASAATRGRRRPPGCSTATPPRTPTAPCCAASTTATRLSSTPTRPPACPPAAGTAEADLARDLGLDSEDQLLPGAATAYLDAADQTFWDETERIAREHLAGTGLAETGTEPGR